MDAGRWFSLWPQDRAEMIAHDMEESIREAYDAEQREKKPGGPAAAGNAYDAFDAMRSRAGL